MSVELAEIYSKQAHLTSAWAKILAYEPPGEPRQLPQARPRNLSRRLSPDQIRAIIEKYEAGQDSRQLATQFNISAPSVLRLLHQGGVHVRGH
jgi:DNA-directed RNA polymerase specialized sigma24 family protein